MNKTLENLSETLQLSPEIQLDMVALGSSLVVSILLGMMLMLLYHIYFRENEPRDASLARSLVFLTPALTATFWMIQTSLVLSLGLLGSLSFVRFRTPVKRAEDVSFVVLALAVAISCAINQFLIGLGLVCLLFIYTLGRNLFSKRLYQDRYAILTFNTKKATSAEEISKVLGEAKVKSEFVSSRTYDGVTSFVFNIAKMKKQAHDQTEPV